jgi:hypothetical protein
MVSGPVTSFRKADVDGVREVALSLPRTHEALVRDRVKFRSDLRYNWVVVRLGAIDDVEMREIVLDAWRMVIPERVAAEHLGNP